MGVDLDEGDRVAAQHMGWGNIGWAYLHSIVLLLLQQQLLLQGVIFRSHGSFLSPISAASSCECVRERHGAGFTPLHSSGFTLCCGFFFLVIKNKGVL